MPSLELMRAGRPLDAVPEFGNRYCSNLELLFGTRGHPVLEVESALFASNEHVSVENYRHLSAGVLSALRAACRSRCHALASFSGNSTLARASAKSRPTQIFSLSGT